mmetsp:Transcript_8308/g.8469  ORF Transcript_8308/g.8469 Transcript_8308/m.8469 type:complete len:268 (-) Transcript_8308:211-1014(-)
MRGYKSLMALYLIRSANCFLRQCRQTVFRSYSTSLFVIKLDESRPESTPSLVEDAKLIHEDADIIVIEKPHNLLCSPGMMEKYNIATAVAEMYNISRVDHMIVHRIDYATSGLLVFARHEKALVELHKQFREKKRLYKRYTAVVKGILPTLEGEIDLPIGRDPSRGPPFFMIHVEEGKRSMTHWTVVKHGVDKTYVHLYPQSGRTHQLRLHMAAIGHPILGDYFYAPDDAYAAAPRLMLHAESLGLVHPVSREDMIFRALCPLKQTV